MTKKIVSIIRKREEELFCAKDGRKGESRTGGGCMYAPAAGMSYSIQRKEFNSRTGFPNFWMHIGDHVKEHFLDIYGREGIQLLRNSCGHHLGHLFNNKITHGRLRNCLTRNQLTIKKLAECEEVVKGYL